MVTVRPATADEHATVLAIIEAAALRTSAATVERAIDDGDVLVATPDDADRVLGVLVLDGTEVVNVAVRPRRRGQGIGKALVEAAADRHGRLMAECHADLRPFYASLGFDLRVAHPDDPDSNRLRGVLER